MSRAPGVAGTLLITQPSTGISAEMRGHTSQQLLLFPCTFVRGFFLESVCVSALHDHFCTLRTLRPLFSDYQEKGSAASESS